MSKLSARRLCWFWFVLSAFCLQPVLAGEEPQLEYTRIDLTDGRTLKNVVIKTYDPKTDRLLVLADRKAMTVPLTLVPAPIRARFRADAPPSGTTTNVVAEQARRPAPTAPTTSAPVVTAPRPEIPPGPSPEQQALALQMAHRQVALDKAQKFYRYEFQMGSSSVKVTALDFETVMPREVPGWTGRYETTGKVFLEYFDSVGRSFRRTTSTFTVLTELKPGEGIVVVGFDTKT